MVAENLVERLRHCLKAHFTVEALHQLCYDSPTFKPVYNHLTADMSLMNLINRLVDYAEKESALAELEQLVGPCAQDRRPKQKIRAKVPRVEQVRPAASQSAPTPSISISIGGSNQGPIITGDHNTVDNQVDEDEDSPLAE